MEYLAISRILKNAPSKYMRSYIDTEQDENDLTYFHLYQLGVLQRSIKELHEYLAERMREQREFQVSLATLPSTFNPRQLAVLEHAVKHPAATYTAQSHAGGHAVTVETARQDLRALDARGLLLRAQQGKANVWHPVADLPARLQG